MSHLLTSTFFTYDYQSSRGTTLCAGHGGQYEIPIHRRQPNRQIHPRQPIVSGTYQCRSHAGSDGAGQPAWQQGTNPHMNACRILAVYRLRSDGDWEIIAAFERDNCAPYFEDNSGEGAQRLCKMVQEALTFDNEYSCVLEFDDWSRVRRLEQGRRCLGR